MNFGETYLGYKGLYQISNKGRVKVLNFKRTNKAVALKPRINRYGKAEIVLSKNGRRSYKTLARVVYETFSGKQLGKSNVIQYKDNNPLNCSFNNLYLISKSKVQIILFDTGKRKAKKYEYYGEYISIRDIKEATGMTYDAIRNRIQRLNWNSYEAIEVPIANTNTRKEKMRNATT